MDFIISVLAGTLLQTCIDSACLRPIDTPEKPDPAICRYDTSGAPIRCDAICGYDAGGQPILCRVEPKDDSSK